MFKALQFAVIMSVLTFAGVGILSAEPYYDPYGSPYPYPPAYAAPAYAAPAYARPALPPAPVVLPPAAAVQPRFAIPPGSQVYVVVAPNAQVYPGPRHYGYAPPPG